MPLVLVDVGAVEVEVLTLLEDKVLLVDGAELNCHHRLDPLHLVDVVRAVTPRLLHDPLPQVKAERHRRPLPVDRTMHEEADEINDEPVVGAEEDLVVRVPHRVGSGGEDEEHGETNQATCEECGAAPAPLRKGRQGGLAAIPIVEEVEDGMAGSEEAHRLGDKLVKVDVLRQRNESRDRRGEKFGEDGGVRLSVAETDADVVEFP
mmetsp:Transcript_13410/g.26626  ORF Transcript_13410/g.26626 Transcript_13410/m.26626 type:complete len:206 (-) Transcript_13410:911-1528(-)